MMKTLTASSVALLIALGISGCASDGQQGYSSEELYDPSFRSVAVNLFENRSFYREIEFQLTEALTKEIESRTPYKVTHAGGADTQITGTILSANKRLLSRSRDGGIGQELQLTVIASFEWKDLRSGRIVRKRSTISGTGEFVPALGLSEPVEIARHEAVSELSREIVSVMRSDW
ncbi:MAG: LPS assembly lipoprotein LptE [Planctomycetota bacterium]|jgi:hypothetical protein